MATGKIVQFSLNRGYGFIAPDEGGEEIFVHASDLNGSADTLRTGMSVEFGVLAGKRGLKAYDVRVFPDPAAAESDDSWRAPMVSDFGSSDNEKCEVVSTADYLREITDVLVGACPGVTAAEIMTIRNRLVGFARRRGWLED